MKAGATPELIALLRSREPVFCPDLYEITLANGTVLRYTTADVPIPYDGHTYDTGILWERGKVQHTLGLQAGTLDTTAYADLDDFIDGLLFHDWLRRGGLNGAYLVLCRAYYAYAAYYNFASAAPVGALWRFSGRDPEVVTGGLKAQITWKSPCYLLDQQMPRNLYQAACGHVLYDPGCAVDKASYAVPGVVQPDSTGQVIQTILPQAADYFTLGMIQFTSGALAGNLVTIAQHGGDNTLTLIPPLLTAPAPGDSFTVWPGCHKTTADCSGKFGAGRAHPWNWYYGGEPWIPRPETAR